MPTGGRLTINTANVEIDQKNGAAGIATGRYVALSVVDSGRGMDNATLARAFEPFFTTKGLAKGTGLGLSTVHGIVKQSDGDVAIVSRPGSGTTVTVYLPLRDAAPSEARPKSIPAASAGKETVLVVEDERAMRVVVERVLRKAGYTVLAAESGAAALALFNKCDGNVDLLLTDVVMPQMSGRQVAEQLRQIKPTLKVLYMSGYTDETIDRHGVLEPGVQLINKPFEAAELAQRVRLILDDAQPQRRSIG
jgi:CheY-like chemotaxis protein